MTDNEFVELIADFYRSELERTGDSNKASKSAERYRSGLIVAWAKKAAEKLKFRAAITAYKDYHSREGEND